MIRSTLLATFLAVLCCSSLFAQEKNHQRVNLGPKINTPDKKEIQAILSPNGKRLYFSREIEGLDYDVYCSDMDKQGQWKKAVPIRELNNSSRNSVNYVYPDGNRLILSGSYSDKQGLFTSTYSGSEWSAPVPLSFEKEPDKWENQNASLTTNGKVMVISNKADLFVSFLKPNNLWTEPYPIKALNTAGYEYTVFLASDDKTLYFSSNGYKTIGSNDIQKTTRLDDTWQKWSPPEDLDSTINSAGWESYFSMSAAGDDAYVYSLEEGNGDLFRIPMTAATKPNPVAVISGTVINAKTKSPLAAEITYDDMLTNQNAGTAQSNATDGTYTVVLQYGKKYSLAAQADKFYALADVLDLTEVSSYQEIHKDILMMPMEVGETVRLNNLFFEYNKSELKPESFSELDRLVTILAGAPKLKIEISGHTDNVGPAEYNDKLSLDRVNAVIAYLTGKNINTSRLTGKGYGKSKPIATNETEEGRAVNRRVEFTILSK